MTPLACTAGRRVTGDLNCARGPAGCPMPSTNICAAMAVALALEELDRSKALEMLPTPEALLERMRARENDFNLLVGVCAAYLKAQGGPNES